jgi:hypothetical protein
VGRFVRTLAGRPADLSYLFLPADRLLRMHAAEVEEELLHVLKAAAEPGEGELDELAERRRTEPDAPEAFIPLAADVAPQLALFGGGPPPPVVKPVAFAGPPAVADEPAQPEPGVPAFKRRARLRDKRHGLVKTLAGFTGSSHREINTWVNRLSGVGSVGEATIEQLEKAIELLNAELDRLSRRRAAG